MNRMLTYVTGGGLPLTFIVFYAVGLVLYFVPPTHDLFIRITPFSLILVTVAVFSHHKNWSAKTVLVLVGIFLLSIMTEIVGVATGRLFGSYTYGEGLGIKVADVPVVIGINWIFLSYASHGIVSRYKSKKVPIIVGAAVLMVFYDVLLEKVAPLMNMWQFSEDNPPIHNYVVWFLLALIFNWALQQFEVNTENRPARWLFFIQCCFFTIIVAQHIYQK